MLELPCCGLVLVITIFWLHTKVGPSKVRDAIMPPDPWTHLWAAFPWVYLANRTRLTNLS